MSFLLASLLVRASFVVQDQALLSATPSSQRRKRPTRRAACSKRWLGLYGSSSFDGCFGLRRRRVVVLSMTVPLQLGLRLVLVAISAVSSLLHHACGRSCLGRVQVTLCVGVVV